MSTKILPGFNKSNKPAILILKGNVYHESTVTIKAGKKGTGRRIRRYRCHCLNDYNDAVNGAYYDAQEEGFNIINGPQ